jgi:hypothetical protein
MSGTSMATPMVNGAMGLIRCYLKEGFYPSGTKTVADTFGYISAALMRSLAIVSADPNVGSYVVPDSNIGWGRIDVDSVLHFAGDKRKLRLVDDTTGLATGEYAEATFYVDSSTVPLRIALVWTDTAAAVNANPTLVNNLHLLVTAPGGATYYRGNQYTSGQSTVNPLSWDNLNTEECVRVNSPAVGTWTLRVNANNVVTARQPYAWAITGAVSDPLPPPNGDVGCTRIVAPVSDLDSGASVIPACSTYNYGTVTASYQVRMKVGTGYNQTAAVINQPPATGSYVTFPNWTASPRGLWAVSCSTELASDTNAANNGQTGSVTVNVHDVGVAAIVAPLGGVDSGTVIMPQAVARNFGTTAESFNVRFLIEPAYLDSLTVNLAAGESDTLSFADWTASPLGWLSTKCTTLLAGDMIPANNLITDSVRVNPLTGIEEGRLGLPRAFALEEPKPNPFTQQTVIRYSLPYTSQVALGIYSPTGRLLRMLVRGSQPPGYYSLAAACGSFPEGIYYVRLLAGEFTKVRKLVKTQ